jgi:shikimate 5-dehydrogenase
MAIVQALKQFEIYTGKEVLNEEKIEIIRQLLK